VSTVPLMTYAILIGNTENDGFGEVEV